MLAGERSPLSARQFLISHNVRMSPSSIQFQLQFRFFSFLFYLHLMSSSVDVVFFVFCFFFFSHALLNQSNRERREFRLEREQSEHPSAGVDKKAECSGSVQGQSER